MNIYKFQKSTYLKLNLDPFTWSTFRKIPSTTQLSKCINFVTGVNSKF